MSGNEKNDGVGDQLQLVLELMEKRSKGEASNAQVEAAVSSILSGMGSGASSNSTNPTPASAGSKKRKAKPIESTTVSPAEAKRRKLVAMAERIPNADRFRIKEDTENYDSSSDEDGEKCPKDQAKDKVLNDDEAQFDDEEDDEVIDDGKNDEDYQDELEQIPLGKPGAQMMTTFGDGPKPAPEAVSAALLGCRRCLQVAIWDARGLRRTSKEDFSRAKKSLSTRRGGVEHTYGVDPKMLFRALSKNDKLAYDPKCGFDVEQLQKLFPEEMAAYFRWVDMRAAYEESSAEQQTVQDKEGDGDKEEEKDGKDGKSGDIAKDVDDSSATISGRLYERAGHFDTRTKKMKKNWYLKFAKTRQGSFLPRGRSKAQLQWDQSQTTKAGQKTAGVWHTMPAASVQFLHWAGFDPPELPPPDEITTHALAFLAYNFLGKIVEKVKLLLCVIVILRHKLTALTPGIFDQSTGYLHSQQ